MQWTGPGSGARDQIIGQKWLTRWGEYGYIANISMAAYRASPYPGKNLRGLTFCYAMRDADIQTEFGQDVVLTGSNAGVAEDLLAPAGVLDDNLILPDAPPQRTLINLVMFGYVPRMYCVAPAAVDQVILTLGSVTGGGTCLNYGFAEFTSGRQLRGSGTISGAAGAFDLGADAATIDWTIAGGAAYCSPTEAQGVGSGGAGGIPTVTQGLVGIRKYGAAYTTGIPDSPGLTAQPMCQAIVMCMGTSAGRV